MCDFRLKRVSPAVHSGFKPCDADQAGVYGPRAWRRRAAAARYPEVAFAPVPERYVVRRLKQAFDGLPLKAPFPDVTTHVEKKGDGIFVTDEAARSGRHALKVQDRDGLTYAYNPHFTFACAFTNGAVENTFAVRLQEGAEFFCEWRDYPEGGGNGYATGPCLVFAGGQVVARTRVRSADGAFRGSERVVAELPAGAWARVTVRARVGTEEDGTWSVQVERDGAALSQAAGLAFCSDRFRAVEWLGFCSTAKRDVAYYLDDFAFGEAE
jgi:hypothetical protein